MSKETKAELQARVEELEGDLRKVTEHRDELQEFADSLRGEIRAASLSGDRILRAFLAGAKRYKREQLRSRQLNERILQQANHRVELVEHAAMELSVSMLEAIQDAHESRKIAAAATRRADKLAAKLVRRGGALGRERKAWVGQLEARERALENAHKRAKGLQESLREAKFWNRVTQANNENLRGQVAQAEEREGLLRRKLRTANKSVLMASLGGGLEVAPMSGRHLEDTSGYSSAAQAAATSPVDHQRGVIL